MVTTESATRPAVAHLLRTLPKVELHRHIEDAAGEHRNAPVTAADYHALGYQALRASAAAGVVHTEFFLSPRLHLRRGVRPAVLWDGLTGGLRDAEADTGARARIIVNVDRSAGSAAALDELEQIRDRSGLLVGVGGDGPAREIDVASLVPAFRRAAARGLRRTLHAGELDSRSVADAVRYLGCERIDHGSLVVDDTRLMRQAADMGIGFTACPTSSVAVSKVFGSVGGHTLRTMLRAGMRVTLGTDRPARLGVDLADEYGAVLAAGLADPAGLRTLAVNGVDACWLPDRERSALRRRVAEAWDAALPQLTPATPAPRRRRGPKARSRVLTARG
ncbi:adenosine deaminase/aminodeoxyfutalosine deaminase [Murinocardiopsis flavida]|uniref:Adenosine deaminase/aminodeoxyfutalosine deaminase n=1 Tax=Murinocardiopsis flavida TaxID=645275 RepID=A0A2P8CCA0_9ACTN|nr:hypothetical protein [Murinocardiopsis flavida]PSK82606.1 adenosine deaminase/aminodeoxyfutalosine deaminase [Murinocardiopsis flavida]